MENQLLDLAASAFILLFIIAPRFNTWTPDVKAMFTGTPDEYIDRYRYLFFLGVYLFTYIVLAIALHNFPQLLSLLPQSDAMSNWGANIEEVFGDGSITINFLLLTMLLNNTKVNAYEERWRYHLHAWGRIPKAVEELKNDIIFSDCFEPNPNHIEIAINEVKHNSSTSEQGAALEKYWLKSIENWKQERENNSIDWAFIECVLLLIILRDLRGFYTDDDMHLKANRIRDIGKLIPFLNANDTGISQHKEELDNLSALLIECICKHMVKKHPDQKQQHTAFKNLGFNLAYHDSPETRVTSAIVVSIIGIMFINTVVTHIRIQNLPDTFFLRSIPAKVLVENVSASDLELQNTSGEDSISVGLTRIIINHIPEQILINDFIDEYLSGPIPGGLLESVEAEETVLVNEQQLKEFLDKVPDNELQKYQPNQWVLKLLSREAIAGLPDNENIASAIKKARWHTFEKWSIGGFVALAIAMFVGVLVQKVNAFRQMEASITVYAVTLLLSSTAAFIYFNWASTSPGLGQIMLALTYSTVAIVVFRSLDDINHEWRAVINATITNAIVLGLVMAALQVSTSLSFSYTRVCASGCENYVYNQLTGYPAKYLFIGLSGFINGLLLGALITYLIQDSMRRQQVSALRSSPRAKFNHVISVARDGEERRVDARNISREGALIKCDCNLKIDDEVSVRAPFLGSIKGIIRWTRPHQWGKQLAGIEFTDVPRQDLNNFLRQKFGEFYA